jgi:hypothetical protein
VALLRLACGYICGDAQRYSRLPSGSERPFIVLVMVMKTNKSMEPTGASRSGEWQFVRQWRLAPAAHAWR